MRVPKVVMQEVKRRQQLIELRKTDPGIEYKNFDYVCCQEIGKYHRTRTQTYVCDHFN